MKKPVALTLVCVALVTTGFVAGRVFQHLRSGYHYEVRKENIYSWKTGEIRWRYVTESIGLPLLDPGTTILEFDGRTIYKAKRGFQESVPFADNVKTGDNVVEWDDGKYRFRLNVEPLPAQPPFPAASPSPPVSPP
jgi:hypothetical protein